jgi:hypothetical protein
MTMLADGVRSHSPSMFFLDFQSKGVSEEPVSIYLFQQKSSFYLPALQRQNAENLNFETENLKQIFPEKEYWGISPNFHIHVSVSEVYIPTMGLPFLLEEICGPILGIYVYKSLTDTGMWILWLRPSNSQKRNI